MSTKILIIYPPYSLEELYDKLKSIGNTSPPLGIGYLGGVLEKNGYEVKIIDAPTLGYNLEDILRKFRNFQPDIVGLTCLTPDFEKVKTLAREIKKEKNIPLIIGGPHLTATPEETMKHDFFDYGVIGEGEETLIELIRNLEKGDLKNLKNIQGIIFQQEGKIVRTQPRPYISNLDSLPFPARHLMPQLEEYHPTPASYRRLPVGTIITSRGCPFQCIYCDRSIFGNIFRFRSPQNVVDEIEVLIKDYGAQELRIWDDTFNAKPERAIEICQEILRRKLDISWTCLGRVNFVNKEMLAWMKKAGCWQISFGIESGDDEVLKKIKKSQTTEMVRSTLKLCQKVGMGSRGFFMLGLPGDTEETMKKTIDFAKSLPLDVVGFYPTIPFPNTELTKMAQKTGELKTAYYDYYHYDQFKMNLPSQLFYVPQGLTEEIIRRYVKKAYHEFYIRPKYLFKQLLKIRNPRDLLNKIKAFFVIKGI